MNFASGIISAVRHAGAVYSYNGSANSVDDLACFDDKQKNNRYTCRVTPGYGNIYSASGGRSCEDKAPFFHIRKNNVGYICAIGWTGQWTCEAFRNTDDMVFRSGIEGVHFRLMPGEKLRTSSVVILPYEGSMVEGQNQWRRLVREYYSLVGAPGRDAVGPLCASIWGGMKTDAVLKRIETIKENQLPYDYLWMDAGWYGIDTEPTASEFGGNWSLHTGDWRVSPLVHPKGLKPVADAAHAGDELAKSIYRECGFYLGRGLSLLIDIINPEVIVLGSIYERSGDLLEQAAMEVIDQEAIAASAACCRIVGAKLGDQIGDYAALSVAYEKGLKL